MLFRSPLVGIVLNRVKGAARSAYGYGYGYGPGHRPGRHAGADEKPSV